MGSSTSCNEMRDSGRGRSEANSTRQVVQAPLPRSRDQIATVPQTGKLVLKKSSISEIKRIMIKENGIPRVGGTKREPRFRAREYERKGYSGILIYAESKKIKTAENELLELASRFEDGYHNKHRKSNLRDIAGYVYIIKGPNLHLGSC
jgi:hypothetical protein